MTTTQRLAASLTPLETALAMLLDGVAPVAPVALPLAETPGCIAAGMPPLALPAFDTATVDGWAFRSGDLVGASSWSPLPLTARPVWVEAGDRMPAGCDCVVDAAAVERNGPLFQVSADAIPGQGVRRAGTDMSDGSSPIAAGRPVRPLDLLIARAAGLDRLAVRRPRLRLVDAPAATGNAVTAQLIADSARAGGCEVICAEASGRNAPSIATAFDGDACDLFVTIGGTGVGRSDATVEAIAARGHVLAHGIALQPGRTMAIGRIGTTPLIALPGAPDQALAGWWMFALPVLDRLSGRVPRPAMTLPLARKIASGVGIAEIVLLRRIDAAWMPLAVGDLPLEAIAGADAWLGVPGGSEGYAAATPVSGYMLRD
ncbi:MAG TPA: molybdopterin-binding protein [Bradyrhizobium sp.]|jgi:molybdopterin biosynthesis enzyme|nr:molybdopterin-binding protein [Bradyrhizobium sp.]